MTSTPGPRSPDPSSARASEEPRELHFAEAVALQDLHTYIRRARRIQEQGVRLQAVGTVLAAWVPVMTPSSLVGRLPAVLGLRTMALTRSSRADVTVELSAITERLARMNPAETVLPLPPSRLSVPWAAVTPPRTGWQPLGELEDDVVRAAAEHGIAEIARTVPETAGAAVVEQVRERVWGRSLAETAAESTAGASTDDVQAESAPADPADGPAASEGTAASAAAQAVPAGAAFGSHALNFLSPEGSGGRTAVHGLGRWLRLSSAGGHILCRRTGI
ncbi:MULTISPECIES: hypothetical protein [Actinomycetes]|uniref:DUF222 domain-containing protein n=2 Tax=Actinomycetes TaxID=1760 RepID=A0ABP6LNQ5_9MICC